MSYFFMFLIVLAVMVVGAVVSLPKSRKRAQSILERQRRLTDNDPRLIEAIGVRDAAIYGIFWGAAPAGLFTVGALLVFSKPLEAIMMFFVWMVPAAILMYLGSLALIFMSYGDALRMEQQRAQGTKGRYGNDVQKMHTVDNTRSEVLDKLEASNKRGPLVLFNQTETEVSKQAEQKRRAADPWNLKKWTCADEDRAVVVGVPGAGKTTFLVAQLVDWMQSGRSFVATDIKPEIWSILKENGLFEQFGYDEYIINPTCANAHRFNLFSEIEDDADLNEVLAVIIPPGEGDGAVFADNARRLLKAVLAHLGERASLPAARDFIMEAGKVSELLEMLAASEKKSVQRIAFELKNTASNERLLASIMTAMGRAFEFMDDDRINAAIAVSDFSMRDVLMKPKQAVFLQFEQKYKASLATLFGGTVAYVLRLLQANASARKQAVFVALDEIINAAPIPKFAESLNTMRSARMPLAMYLQSIEGLNRLYGPQASEIFLGSADLKVIFRLNDNATAEYVSAQLGDTEQRTFNATTGQSSGQNITGATASESASRGYSSSTARIFDAAEVLGLEPQKAITIYRGSGARFTMPSYWQDYPMPARAAVDARPQAGFVQQAEAEAATA
ncbi:type IV secretory system conjugative DNA transfer family protein [Rhodoferax sp.]|uniref:type IV secretory system conjugative DNA transfer family protein n=1 Tax=Rhodoferax sp. TaxID=50421 RepID=UPI003BB53016